MKSDLNNRIEIEACGRTDVGMKRRVNEDVFVLDPQHGVFVVADGMGGHAAGEVASRVATEEILRALSTAVSETDETWPEHWDPSHSAPANAGIDAFAGSSDAARSMWRMASRTLLGTLASPNA